MEEEKNLDLENKAKDEKELSSEELKQQAEALEAENKQLKEQDANKEAELRANYERRLEKAREQNAKLKETINETIKQSVDTRDLVTLGVKGISEDSDEALILKKYKDGGIISSYEAGLNHPGVLAEIEANKADKNAKTIIDENDKEAQARTSKETLEHYRATGQVPEDKKAQNEIALDNLKQMGL